MFMVCYEEKYALAPPAIGQMISYESQVELSGGRAGKEDTRSAALVVSQFATGF